MGRNPRILVIQLRQLGDILLTTPLIRVLKQQFPHGHIACLTHPMGKLVLDDNPYLDRHWIYPVDQGLTSELKLAHALRQEKYDWVIDGMNNPRSALYSLATGAPRRVAFKSKRSIFYTDLVSKVSDYIVREKLLLAGPLGVKDGTISLDLPTTHAHGEVARVFQQSRIAQEKPLIAIAPTHRRPLRRWPLSSYAQLADWLISEKNADVVWIWGPGEEGVIDEVMALSSQKSFKAPKTSFREMAALLGSCQLFIGNSNGPSHVAVAKGTPSIQLHGHTSLVSWCPMNDLHRGIQAPGFGRVAVPDMAGITVEDVKNIVSAMWPTISTHRLPNHVNLSD